MIEGFGYPDRPRATAYGLRYEREYLTHLATSAPSPGPGRTGVDETSQSITFWYRQPLFAMFCVGL